MTALRVSDKIKFETILRTKEKAYSARMHSAKTKKRKDARRYKRTKSKCAA